MIISRNIESEYSISKAYMILCDIKFVLVAVSEINENLVTHEPKRFKVHFFHNAASSAKS